MWRCNSDVGHNPHKFVYEVEHLSELLYFDTVSLSLFQSGANLLGPILAGFLWDSTGHLEVVFFYMGSIMCLGSVFALFQPMAIRRSKIIVSRED